MLIVDDDKLICWALDKELSALRFSTHFVETAGEALAEIRANRYDFVFLDIHLPDGNGIDLLEEIGTIAPDAKIIIMSADASPTNRQRAITEGALQFLEKPFDLSEIHNMLKSTSCGFSQKRHHPRYICRIPLQISIVSPSPEEAQFDLDNLSGLMADIGIGGLRLRTEYPLKVGQSIRPRIAAGNDPFTRFLPPEATAEVVWVGPQGESVTAGLKFLC